MGKTKDQKELKTTAMAYELGISTVTLMDMRRSNRIPAKYSRREGRDLLWSRDKVFEHLRNWKVSKHNVPSWLGIVEHPDAAKYKSH